MQNQIASHYANKLRRQFDKTLWESLFLSYLDKKSFPKQQLKVLIEQEFSKSIQCPLSFYSLLKKLFSLIFYTRLFPYSYEELVFPLLQKTMQRKYPKDFQPIFALQNIIHYLSTLQMEEISPKYLKDGMTFFSSDELAPSLQLPDMKYNLELSLYWKILGVLQNDQSLIQAADKILSWHGNWLDDQSELIYTLWALPGTEKKETNLLFFLLTDSPKKSLFSETFPYFLIAISFLYHEVFSNFSKRKSFINQQIEPSDPATFNYQTKDLSYIVTLRGVNSGLGYMRAGTFSILSFGPHQYPVQNKAEFGIFRTYGLDRQRFENVIKTKDTFSGWAPLCQQYAGDLYSVQPSTKWMYIQALLVSEDVWKLSLRFIGLNIQEKIGFCFFVRAASSFFDQTELSSKESKKIFSSSDSIFFYTLSKKVVFKTSTAKQIIMDTQNKYWDEDFFLTYVVRGDEPTLNVEIQVSN